MTDFKYDLFVSYCRGDRTEDRIRQVLNALRVARPIPLKIQWDENFTTGDTWNDGFARQAIDESAETLVVWSRYGPTSTGVEQEVLLARNAPRTVHFCRLDDVELPPYLGSEHAFDLFDGTALNPSLGSTVDTNALQLGLLIPRSRVVAYVYVQSDAGRASG